MSDPDTLDGTPVTQDQADHERLKALWEELGSSPAFTRRIVSEGYTPPDDREGWSVAYEFGPDGEDLGLVWAEPFYPND